MRDDEKKAKGPQLLSGGDLIRLLQEEERKARDLPASDPDHPFGFEFDREDQIWTIWWGGYEYWFQHADVDTPEKLLNWIEHLTEKEWEGMTVYKLNRFIASARSRM